MQTGLPKGGTRNLDHWAIAGLPASGRLTTADVSSGNKAIDQFIHEKADYLNNILEEIAKEENFKKIATKNKSEHSTIAEIVKVGYRRKLPDSTFQIISKSKVRVFVFEE